MSEVPFDAEAVRQQQFSEALRDLGIRGRMSEVAYQNRKEEYGTEVAEDVGRSAAQPRQTSEAIAQLLRTIPGAEVTQNNIETFGRGAIASPYQVSAFKQRDGFNYTGVSVSIPQTPNGGTEIELERVTGTDSKKRDRVSVSLWYTQQGVLQDGEMRVGTIEDGQFVHTDGGFRFDAQGNVTRSWADMAKHLGKVNKIDAAKITHAITTDEGLSNPVDVRQILAESTPPPSAPVTNGQ